MMDIITIDFETRYDRDYSLSKLTTEEYIRDDRFEVIGVGIKVNENSSKWFSGTESETKQYLHTYDWGNSVALAHNAMFDAGILTERFGIKPYMWADTLSMARAIDGLEVSGSLKAAAERHGIGVKGDEVVQALGKRRVDFTPEELARYGEYCKNDCDLTWELFNVYIPNVSNKELRIIDLTIRMFSEPVLELDLPLLEQHLEDIRDRKVAVLKACEEFLESSKILNSNPKFAEMLMSFNVSPPTKISAKTGKETYAFSKTDEEFKSLLEHEDERVQTLVAARFGAKSTLAEKRTERFIEIAKRGSLPVPLRYYAAHTGRWGGSDKINLQNLPRGALKAAIIPPDGYVIIDSDSSQIEARVLAWLAGQDDLVQAFAERRDVYKIMASKIYGVDAAQVNDSQRFMGKTVVLGCGYGLGASKFQTSLKVSKERVELPLEECQQIIKTYRDTNDKITSLWKQAGRCLDAMLEGSTAPIGVQPQAVYLSDKGFVLPSGYHLAYNELRKEANENGKYEYTYKTRQGRTRIYGGKVVENLVQALARCVIAEQMLWVSEKYRPVLTVHDAIGIIAPKAEAEEAQAYIEACMRRVPKWAVGLPLNCESGIGENYGEC